MNPIQVLYGPPMDPTAQLARWLYAAIPIILVPIAVIVGIILYFKKKSKKDK